MLLHIKGDDRFAAFSIGMSDFNRIDTKAIKKSFVESIKVVGCADDANACIIFILI
jgi:hypothetical protein